MNRSLPLTVVLALASSAARAHDDLVPHGTLHRLLHAVGTERLVVLGGTALAIIVAGLVWRATRHAGRRQDQRG